MNNVNYGPYYCNYCHDMIIQFITILYKYNNCFIHNHRYTVEGANMI